MRTYLDSFRLLLASIRHPRARHPLHAVVGVLALLGLVVTNVTALPSAWAAPGAPAAVSVAWYDSTARAGWTAVPGAAQYRVSLVRVADSGIMQQQLVPATQLVADAQGIWPNQQYEIAVEAVDSTGALGAATLSAPGQAVPISRSQYNGFLDTENVAAGQIDTNLWDEQIAWHGTYNCGDTFVNNQMHYHIAAGCGPGDPRAGNQMTTIQRSRVPFDFSGGRTLTIHGEVDLKGDDHQWFGVGLSPQAFGPDRQLDRDDQFLQPRTLPELELFDDAGRLRLLYAVGDGSLPSEVASAPNPTGLNNVRDEVVWHVSTTHTQVLLNGTVAIDVALPAPLSFTRGYMTLFAENYPGNGGTPQPSCDDFPHDCSIWHIDNWGFDAAAGVVQPQSASYYSTGCGSYPGPDHSEVKSVLCDNRGLSTGQSTTYSVNIPDASTVTDTRVVFSTAPLATQGALKVSVNGGAEQDVPYIAGDVNYYNEQYYVVSVPASLLHSGENSVTFHLANPNAAGGVGIANVELETDSSGTPYVAPPLPPEPAPLGTWGGTQPTPTPSPSPTPSPTPTPVAISNVPCTVTLNGRQQTGVCSGTFTK